MSLAFSVELIVAAIEEQGFCIARSAISAETAGRLRGIVDLLLDQESRPDSDTLGHRRVLHLAAKHAAFVELLCHPLTMSVCEQILGPDFVCSTWTSNTLLRGADLTYWHVDHPYWTIQPPYPVEPALTLHTIWCLDEFSDRNGATKFVPGSHHRTHLPLHEGDYNHEGVTIECPPGSAIFAHGACWHSAGRNDSEQHRTAIFGRYARSYIIPQEDLTPQLQAIRDPSPLVKRLLGGNRYVPQRGLPY